MQHKELIVSALIVIVVGVGGYFLFFHNKASDSYKVERADITAEDRLDRLPAGFDIDFPVNLSSIRISERVVNRSTGQQIFRIEYSTPARISLLQEKAIEALREEGFMIRTQDRDATSGFIFAQQEESTVSLTYDRQGGSTIVSLIYNK